MSKPKVRLKDLKITVRIQMTNKGGLYYGQVYVPETIDDKNFLYYMNCDLQPGWNTITDIYFTKLGCKMSIRAWKKKHFIEVYEM